MADAGLKKDHVKDIGAIIKNQLPSISGWGTLSSDEQQAMRIALATWLFFNGPAHDEGGGDL